MKLGTGVMLTLMAVGGSSLEAAVNSRIPVCMSSPADLQVSQARQITSWLLSSAAVRLEWLPISHCPSNTIVISFQLNTPEELHPKWLAYSQPFERIHIVVFFDRVQASVPARRVGSLLGYVLAHEIVHLVEGTDYHSPEGVMKVRWSGADYLKMYYYRLRFTEFDLQLIQAGLGTMDKRGGGVVFK
jgi:hypothetical protein